MKALPFAAGSIIAIFIIAYFPAAVTVVTLDHGLLILLV